ncbi:Protein of unknown function, partial [Cotesia congregata]
SFIVIFILGPESQLVESTSDNPANDGSNPVNPLVSPGAEDHRWAERPRGVHAASSEWNSCQMGHRYCQSDRQRSPAGRVPTLRVSRCMDHQHQEKRYYRFHQNTLTTVHSITQGRRSYSTRCRGSRKRRQSNNFSNLKKNRNRYSTWGPMAPHMLGPGNPVLIHDSKVFSSPGLFFEHICANMLPIA